MIGNNRIILNEATMIEAVQFWISNKLTGKFNPAPRVTSISEKENAEFEVSLCSDQIQTLSKYEQMR